MTTRVTLTTFRKPCLNGAVRGVPYERALRSSLYVLTLLYEYLCLYVNAFAFQAIVTTKALEARNSTRNRQSTNLPRECLFPQGIMAIPEGRYVFEALRAAKAALMVMSRADPEACLRYMPTRYFLYAPSLLHHVATNVQTYRYSTYCAVFLYKANSFGAFPRNNEQKEVAKLRSAEFHHGSRRGSDQRPTHRLALWKANQRAVFPPKNLKKHK